MNDTLEPTNTLDGPGRLMPAPSRVRRPRLQLLAGGAACAALALGTLAGPAVAAPRPAVTMPATVSVQSVTVAKYGPILETGKGFALYYDTANKPHTWACTGKCLAAWPPLVLPKGQTKPVVGKGVTGIGTVKSPSGLQVTWDHRPLYTFIKDKAGTVKGEKIAGTWYLAQLQAAPSGVAY
jgi:predicted lipoprotein with Yx(FWY)xxD motif